MVPLAASRASVQHAHTCNHSVLRGLQPTSQRHTCRATAVNTTHSSTAISETPLAAAAVESADPAAPQSSAAAEVTSEGTPAVGTAITAADASPRPALTPIQSLAGQILSGSAIGEWRDHSTSQGYVAKPWQQQQRWQQQRVNRSRGRQQQHHHHHHHQQQQSGHDRSQQQQQQQQHWWQVLNNSARSRAVAHSLATAATPNVLLHVLQSAHADEASRGRPRIPNIRHLAAACRALVDVKRQQRRRQQQEGEDSSAQDAVVYDLLHFIDDLLAEQLSDVAAPAPAAAAESDPTLAAAAGDLRHSSSSSSSVAIAGSSPSPALAAAAARCLSTVVYSWGRLQHKPPRELLLLVVEGFMMLLEQQQRQQQQQQQQIGQSEVLQQQRSRGLQQRQQSSRDGGQFVTDVEVSDDYDSSPPDLPEGSSSSTTSSSSDNSAASSSSSSSSSRLDQHQTQALSNLVWGLSKLGFTADKPYSNSSSTASTPQQRRQQCQQQQQYWSRLAAAALQRAHTGTAAAAASVIDISSICYGFAAGGYRDVALWGGLAPRVMTYMDEFMPQALSQVLWAYATVGVPHQGVFTAATPTAVQLMPGFTPQGLVNILWAYQTLFKSVPDKLLAAATAECIKRSSSSTGIGLVAFGPLNLSMLVWVYTKSRSIPPALSAAISRSAIDLLDSFQPSDLCRLLGGLAVLKSLDINLLDAAESRLLGWLESGSVDIQVVCQGVWAYASCNHPSGVRLLQPLLDLAAKRTRFLVRSGDATARLLNILSLLRYRDDRFMSLLAQTIVPAAAAAAPLAAAAVAAGSTGAGDPPVVGPTTPTAAAAAVPKGGLEATPAAAAAVPAAVNHLARWDTKNLIGIAASLAKLGHTHESASNLLRLIIQGFVDRLPSTAAAAAAASSGSSNRRKTLKRVESTWQLDPGARFVPAAAAAAAGGGSEVQYPCTDHTQIKISDHGKISGSILASSILLLWCAAVCDMRKHIGLLLLLAAPVQHAVGSTLSAKNLAQLVQVYLWAQTLGPAGEPLISALPKPLMDQALFFWQYELVPTTIHSNLHSEVMSQLCAMKLRPTKEGVTPDGMFSVDCMVKFKGCDVALEVMGDEHYSVNQIDSKIESCHNSVTLSNNDSALAEPQQDLGNMDKSGRINDNISDKKNNQRCETGGQSVSAKGSSCGGSNEPQHVLLGPEVLRMRLLAARGYALAAVSAFEWESVRSRGGARGLLLQKLEQAVQLHQAAAAAAAGSQFGQQQQQQQTRKKGHKSRQRHQPGDRGTAVSQDTSSSITDAQQQQTTEGVPAIQQQVAHLMKQQGRSPAVIKGRLKREQYWQQRVGTDRQGRLLLNMAVPWTAAKSRKFEGSSSSSSSSGRTITRDDADGGTEGLAEASWLSASAVDTSSGSSGNGSTGSGSNSVGDGAMAGSTLDDSEFDMSLDLDDLLADTSDAPAA